MPWGRYGLNDWARLARLHPEIAFENLLALAQAQTALDIRLLSQVNTVLPVLAERLPDAALFLATEMLRVTPPSRLSLQVVAARRPAEIARLLLENPDGGAATVDLSRLAHRLPDDVFAALLRERPRLLGARQTFLRRLPVALRRVFWETAGRGAQTETGVVDAATVARLPEDLRHAEARRNLALPALATRPAERLPYAALLPYAEARDLLAPFIANPDADLRGLALTALIGAARYDPDHLPDALDTVRRRGNEQDPVRRLMLQSLAALPPSRWQPPHLAVLDTIFADALGAADLSPSTSAQVVRLVVALIPFYPSWAAGHLAIMTQARGQLSQGGFGFGNLQHRLSDADTRRIAPALLPVLQSWEARERQRYLVDAAQGFGRRIPAFTGLTDILERVAASSLDTYTTAQCLALLAKWEPVRFAALVPRLLDADKSMVTQSAVYNFLHRRRQDLLNPFLGQQAYTGRFSTGKTRFVLPVAGGFFRWTPTQQATFAQTLTEVITDPARDTPSTFRAIEQMASLPAVLPRPLFVLAQPVAKLSAAGEKALRALATLDSGEGVPFLIEALNDSRARIAIYALRGAIKEMPPARALALLQSAPLDRVTVAKEVIRLIGEQNAPGVFPILREWSGRDLHRDVRVALLRALWDHAERAETWIIFMDAARNPDPSVAKGVIRLPVDRLSPTGRARLLGLLATLLAHPDPLVRMATLERFYALPVADAGRVVLPALLAALASPLPDECRGAALATFATYPADADATGAAIAALLPNRRNLALVLTEAKTQARSGGQFIVPLFRSILDALAPDPLTAQWQISLALAALPPPETVALLRRLAASDLLHADALQAAFQALAQPYTPLTSNAGDLAGFEAALAASDDARLRRLAFAALLAQAAHPAGWTEGLRARLELYRADPAPLVAAAAQFTALPPEG